MSHLLAISIGPVQGFIAAARKTRDLWYGSELLSEVSRAAARSLRDGGATLIFPHDAALDATSGDGKVAVANKILAVVPHDPAAAFARARDLARAHLDGLHQGVARRITEDKAVRGAVALPLMADQVAEFLEIYGAWVAYNLAEPGR